MNSNTDSYDLEDLIYDEFFEALDDPHTYDKEDFLSVFEVAEGFDPFSQHHVECQGFEGALGLEGKDGKAAYAIVEDKGDEVAVDIKMVGDAEPVLDYIRDQPPEGLTDNMDTVDGGYFTGATARAPEHNMNKDTQTEMPQPGKSPEKGFNNAQANRIRKKVLES